MPASHRIDADARLITTSWSGAAVDLDLVDALEKYQKEIKSLPEYRFFDEIVDFTDTTSFKLTTEGLRRIVRVATRTDAGVKTRLAIVVTSPLAYGLARMYQTFRGLLPGSSKEVSIFRNYGEALGWVANRENSEV